MEFRIDFGNAGTTVPPVAQGALFALADGAALRVATDVYLWRARADGSSQPLSRLVWLALDHCREFRTLEDHAARLCERLPALRGRHQEARRMLEDALSRGLLLGADRFVARFAVGSPHAAAACAGVFIRACDRPEQLRHLLGTLVDYERRFSPRHRYVVVDDSQQAAHAQTHATMLREFAAAVGVAAAYFGATQRQQLAGEIAGVLGDTPALRQALLSDPAFAGRRGGGHNKNLITLLSAGASYVLLDDDFGFPLHRHPEFTPGLGLRESAWAIRTYGSRAQALAAGEPWPDDPIATHLQLLGGTLAQAVHNRPDCALSAEALYGVAPSRAPELDPQRRIVATVNGHRGASGAGALNWLFMLDAPGRAGLDVDPAAFEASLGDPAVWFGTRRFQPSLQRNFTPFAVDNTRLAPCTSPLGRSEDALYSALCGVLWSDGVTLDAPMSIEHRPEAGRDRRDSLRHAETPDLNLCLSEWLRDLGARLNGQGAGTRLQTAVAALRDLADAPQAAAGGFLSDYLAQRRATLAASLQRTLDSQDPGPAHWQQQLRALVALNRDAVERSAAPRFAGWPEGSDTDACVARFRSETTGLADALQAWPAAWEYAAERCEHWLAGAAL